MRTGNAVASSSRRASHGRRAIWLALGCLVGAILLGGLVRFGLSLSDTCTAIDCIRRGGGTVVEWEDNNAIVERLSTYVGKESFGTPLGVLFDKSTVPTCAIDAIGRLPSVQWVGFLGCHVTADNVKALAALPQLTEVVFAAGSLSAGSLSVDALENLCALGSVETLAFYGGTYDDSVLYAIRDLSNVRTLKLSYSSISDTGMEHLRQLKSLTYLDVSHTQIGSRGLEVLTDLRSLQGLRLSCTGIGDDAIEVLQRLSNLEFLDVTDNALSPEAIRRLRGLLPDCRIITGSLPDQIPDQGVETENETGGE